MDPTPSETADLLERAADLYESERIEWCSGGWARPMFNGLGGQFHCAEGALLRAAGYTWIQVLDATLGADQKNPAKIFSLMRRPEIQQAIRAVNGHIVSKADGAAWLWNMNDGLNKKSAKQHLIEAFKDAAKELRNGS